MLKKFVPILIIVILAILGCTRIARDYYWDITQNKINSLNDSSKKLLAVIDAPLYIKVYSTNIQTLNTCAAILAPYKKQSKLVTIELHESLLDPAISAKLKVTDDSNILVTYKNHQRAIDIDLTAINEQQISSLIQQVVNNTNHWLVFLTGHQEQDPLDTSPLGLSDFAKTFKTQGMNVAELNLAQQQAIPNNTDILIVANPQLDLLPLEKVLIHNYLQQGGKLIWFTEPDSSVKSFIQEEFGLKLSKGVIIDPHSTKLGSPHPALKVLINHGDHLITNDIKTATIFPWSGNLEITNNNHAWQPEVFISTTAQTWTYAGLATQDLDQMANHKEKLGPLNIGVALTKESGSKEQRAMIIADSTFVSNKYLSLYANSQLANNLVNWAQNDEHHYMFSPSPARDLSYQPGSLDRFLFRYGFTIMLPLLLMAIGLLAERRI